MPGNRRCGTRICGRAPGQGRRAGLCVPLHQQSGQTRWIVLADQVKRAPKPRSVRCLRPLPTRDIRTWACCVASLITGYYYRILTAQGEHAPDGARNYLVKAQDDRRGLRLSRIRHVTAHRESQGFLVNHDGMIYEKDLGQNTKAAAVAITTFNPGSGWKKSEQAK